MFLLKILNQDRDISPCSCSQLSLPGKGHVLVKSSHTEKGLGTLFLFLQFLDLVWNFLVPCTPYSAGSRRIPAYRVVPSSYKVMI